MKIYTNFLDCVSVFQISQAAFDELLAELKKLRKLVTDHEKRIKILEGGKPDANGEIDEDAKEPKGKESKGQENGAR